MIEPSLRRRFFAEELEAVCKLRSAALVDAFAVVPREQFRRDVHEPSSSCWFHGTTSCLSLGQGVPIQ
jgi:hypothetical protein